MNIHIYLSLQNFRSDFIYNEYWAHITARTHCKSIIVAANTISNRPSRGWVTN